MKIEFYRSVKGIVGNIIYRVTGDDSWVDAELNARANRLPTRKEWKFYLSIIGTLIILLIIAVIATSITEKISIGDVLNR